MSEPRRASDLAAAGEPTAIPLAYLAAQLEVLVRDLARACQIDDHGDHEKAGIAADMAVADFINSVPEWIQTRLARTFERRIQQAIDVDQRKPRTGQPVSHGKEQFQILLAAIVEARRLRGETLSQAAASIARTMTAQGRPVTARRIIRWRQRYANGDARERYLRLASTLQAHPEHDAVVIDRLARHHLTAVTKESVCSVSKRTPVRSHRRSRPNSSAGSDER